MNDANQNTKERAMERTYWAVVTKSGFEYRFGDNKRQAEMFAEKCNAKSAQFVLFMSC
jgi:hypothetical protein